MAKTLPSVIKSVQIYSRKGDNEIVKELQNGNQPDSRAEEQNQQNDWHLQICL